MLFLSILFSLISMPAFSQSCTGNGSRDHTRGTGALAQLPAIDQGDTGLCYAFTVSQLVDARRYTNPQNRRGRISPLALGLMTPQSSNYLNRSRLDDGGSPQAALNTVNTQGNPLCDLNYLTQLYGDADAQFTVFGTLELMFKRLREAYYAPCNCTPNQRVLNARGEVTSMRSWITSESLVQGEPIGGMADFVGDMGNIVLRLNNLNSQAFANYNSSFNQRLLTPMFARMCEGRTVAPPRLRLTGVRKSQYEFNTNLTSANATTFNNYAWNILAQPNAQPVGISFCSKMLTTNSTFVSPASSAANCGNHAAVLAGIRCVNGQRQFLLRNSWGNNCGSQLAQRHRANCDGRGNLWVDASMLMQSAYSLYQTVP